jgi:hypothetical protein
MNGPYKNVSSTGGKKSAHYANERSFHHDEHSEAIAHLDCLAASLLAMTSYPLHAHNAQGPLPHCGSFKITTYNSRYESAYKV